MPLAALVILGACLGPGQDRLSGTEKETCEAGGGYVSIAGFSGSEFCAVPAPDAGRACSRASDCAVRCEAETRTCATHFDGFGCFNYLNDSGQEEYICVD